MLSKLAKFFGISKPAETPAIQALPEPVAPPPIIEPVTEAPAPKKKAAAKKTATKPRTPRTKK